MKHQKLWKIVFLGFLLIAFTSSMGFSLSQDEIDTQIDETKKKLSETKRHENSVLGTLVRTQQNLEKLSSNLENLSSKLGTTEQQINVISYQLNIAETQLEQIKAEVEDRKKVMDQRLIALYKHGYQSSLEILFNARNFAEFIARFVVISDYIDGDLKIIRALQAQQNLIAKKKAEIDQKRQDLLGKKTMYFSLQRQNEREQSRMLTLTQTKQQELEILQNNRKILEQALDELEETSKEMEVQIRDYQNQNHSALGTGKYIWPAPGDVIQQFGWRIHPILRRRKFHTGIDITSPHGTTIIAADSGVVIFAGFNGGYGKMVAIDHGAGISTLYAHASLLLVDKGQAVTQGQAIAKVGSTGLSTGPHLHFEIRKNGSPVNPLSYL